MERVFSLIRVDLVSKPSDLGPIFEMNQPLALVPPSNQRFFPRGLHFHHFFFSFNRVSEFSIPFLCFSPLSRLGLGGSISWWAPGPTFRIPRTSNFCSPLSFSPFPLFVPLLKGDPPPHLLPTPWIGRRSPPPLSHRPPVKPGFFPCPGSFLLAPRGPPGLLASFAAVFFLFLPYVGAGPVAAVSCLFGFLTPVSNGRLGDREGVRTAQLLFQGARVGHSVTAPLCYIFCVLFSTDRNGPLSKVVPSPVERVSLPASNRRLELPPPCTDTSFAFVPFVLPCYRWSGRAFSLFVPRPPPKCFEHTPWLWFGFFRPAVQFSYPHTEVTLTLTFPQKDTRRGKLVRLMLGRLPRRPLLPTINFFFADLGKRR